ncbi:MAG: DUF968 domain-containing protein [Alphaproteobacteria bacterium]|nr:MAG: DUF968 domain-containing protein [Alphaproteobacteria bacterium]
MTPCPKPHTIRSNTHLRWIRTQPCVACQVAQPPERLRPLNQGRPRDACHVRTAANGGVAMKPSDEWTVPMCPAHHREQHEGTESFQTTYGLDLAALAKSHAARSPSRKIRDASGDMP